MENKYEVILIEIEHRITQGDKDTCSYSEFQIDIIEKKKNNLNKKVLFEGNYQECEEFYEQNYLTYLM